MVTFRIIHTNILLILAITMMNVRASATGTDIAPRSRLDLSGEWETELGMCILPGTTDENRLGKLNRDTSETTCLTRLYPYSGKLRYEKLVTIPDDFSGRRLRLVMERTKPSSLYVDGMKIGGNDLLLSPQVYELPELAPGIHRFSIEIDNSADSVPAEIFSSHAMSESTQTNWNGILGEFFIEAADSTWISDVRVFPDVRKRVAVIEVEISAHKKSDVRISAEAFPWNNDGMKFSMPQPAGAVFPAGKGKNVFRLEMDMGDNPLLWSEFHPSMYRLEVDMSAGQCRDRCGTDFGMREFKAEGTRFVINGFKTFLRGKHDACVFPLTGYPPMTVSEWREVFRTAGEYGINHYRFHSWTPPEAAFEAADIEGVYLQPELPLWAGVSRENTRLNAFLTNEARSLLDAYGNHPSFVMFGLGNELHGDVSLMREWVDEMREYDSRHLYSFGSNNNLGWEGPQEGEDFFVTCRVGGREGYSSHVRTSFAHADAEKGGILNNTRPGTAGDYSVPVSDSRIPVVGHETCQFFVYPDYDQISKYTGVLYPWNLVEFRKRLEEAGLGGMDKDFCMASGKFAVECDKADIEYALRTPGFGGFQILDLQDYPGQGTALVGVLDAFMESKGIVSPEYFRGFCSPVVPLASFNDCCLYSSDTLNVGFLLANYLERGMDSALSWEITVGGKAGEDNENAAVSGSIEYVVPQGEVSGIGGISLPLSSICKGDADAPCVLNLHIGTEGYSNRYRLWVYPDETEPDDGIVVAEEFGDSVLSELENGGTVLLVPSHDSISGKAVGGQFIPEFWNWSMFRRISLNAGKEISPGTLSVFIPEGADVLSGFPNDGHSDMQWWSITRNSMPLIMDSLPEGYTPYVGVIDNPERCHRLGILFGFSVGKGRLLVCTTDLDAIASYPEGKAYRNSIIRYMKSPEFNPPHMEAGEIERLFKGNLEKREIEGAENPTSYL